MERLSGDTGEAALARCLWTASVPDLGDGCALARLSNALRDALTETQLRYMTHYYAEELTMEELGALYGVDKSTVSRTIARGKDRLRKLLAHTDPTLLREALGKVPEIRRLRRSKGRGGQGNGA